MKYTINKNPQKSGWKFLFVFLLMSTLVSMIFSCSSCRSQYKYKVYKVHIFYPTDDSTIVESVRLSGISNIWYIKDTFQIKDDTLSYKNSSGKIVVIPPPFQIVKHK